MSAPTRDEVYGGCRWTLEWPVPPPLRLRGGSGRESLALNHMYVWTGRGGQRRLCGFAEQFKQDVIRVVLESPHRRLPEGDLALSIDLHPPDARKRDVDGPVKLVQDAVFEACGADDYRVVDLRVRRHAPDRSAPRIEVVIERAIKGEREC